MAVVKRQKNTGVVTSMNERAAKYVEYFCARA